MMGRGGEMGEERVGEERWEWREKGMKYTPLLEEYIC